MKEKCDTCDRVRKCMACLQCGAATCGSCEMTHFETHDDPYIDSVPVKP